MEGCIQVGKKSVSILILFLSIIAVLPTALCAEEDAIYAVMPEDQQVYENDFFLSADDLEYVGAAALESVAVSTDGRYMLCFSDSLTHHINLYDRACILVRHFAFYESGAISVSFDEKDGGVILFPYRKNVLFKIDDEGDYVGSSRDELESDRIAKKNAMTKFQVLQAGNVYTFYGRNIFSADNQKFTVEDCNGNLMFEYVPSDNPRSVILLIFGISFITICFFVTTLICKKQN